MHSVIFHMECVFSTYTYCSFLVRQGGISHEFGRAIIRILAKGSRSSQITTARPPDMPPKRTKMIQLGIYCTQIRPSEHDMVATSGQRLDIRTV